MDRGRGESNTLSGNAAGKDGAPPKVTTKGKINWFVIVLHVNANSFVVMCTFKFCHLWVMKGLLTRGRKANTLERTNASGVRVDL